jgi:hypothetical protein
MPGGQRLISWLHPCSTRNLALNTRTYAHGPLMGHPNRVGCDVKQEVVLNYILFTIRKYCARPKQKK